MRGGLAGLHRAAVSPSRAFRKLGWALISGSGSCSTQLGVWPSWVFLPAGCALDFLFSPKAADHGFSQAGWPCAPVVSPALSLPCLVTEALPPWLALRLCGLPPGPDEPWGSAHSGSLALRSQGEMKCCFAASLPLYLLGPLRGKAVDRGRGFTGFLLKEPRCGSVLPAVAVAQCLNWGCHLQS